MAPWDATEGVQLTKVWSTLLFQEAVRDRPTALEVRRAREALHCYGNYRAQPLEHALTYCLRCRVVTTCVQRQWRKRERRSRRWMTERT